MGELAVVLMFAGIIGAFMAVVRDFSGPVPFARPLDRPLTWWVLAASFFAVGALLLTLV